MASGTLCLITHIARSILFTSRSSGVDVDPNKKKRRILSYIIYLKIFFPTSSSSTPPSIPHTHTHLMFTLFRFPDFRWFSKFPFFRDRQKDVYPTPIPDQWRRSESQPGQYLGPCFFSSLGDVERIDWFF